MQRISMFLSCQRIMFSVWCLMLPVLALAGNVQYNNKARQTKYDYIVVGAGSAGSALANRLSEDGKSTVLLLEAGGPPPSISEVPYFCQRLADTEMEWNNLTEPQNRACLSGPGKRCMWTRAKALGGCSSHNYMMFVRGNKRDYNTWENLGAKGWNYENVLRVFKKLEDHRDPNLRKNKKYHGTKGYQTVSPVAYPTKLGDAYLEAGKYLKHKIVDYNAESQLGYARGQFTERDGLRCSTEKSYLRPAAKRRNLDILIRAFVLKVNFDDEKQAVSVSFDHEGKTKEIEVVKEVIISAGTMSSPKILMLSGIGPRKHLEDMKIPVIVDLPGVGENLQDHQISVHLNYVLNDSVGIVYERDINPEAIGELVNTGGGPLTSPGGEEGVAFINTKYQKFDDDWPDIQIITGTHSMFVPVPTDFSNQNATGLLPMLLRPKSRGILRLRSPDPYDDPSIDPRYFSDPENDDMRRTIEGVRLSMELMATPSLQKYNPQLKPAVLEACKELPENSDEQIECLISNYALAGFHFAGTCRMGDPKDNTTVVDPQLRVLGVKKLRVADGSIMPTIVSGNMNGPCIMIGEMAAEIIKSQA